MSKKSGFITVSGKRLEISWHGPSPKNAPSLVFLHEGLGCTSMWRDFPAKLASRTGCGAIVFSRAGYGKSDPCSLPRSIYFMHREGLEILPELLIIAKIEKCVLIGHSDGGSIAIIFAGRTSSSHSLCGIITEAAHVFCEETTIRSIEASKKEFKSGNLRKRLQKFHGPNTDCAFWGWNGAWLNPDFASWNIEKYLPHIKVPFLALQGDSDEYGTIAQLDSIARNAPASEVLRLSDCGHSPHREKELETLDTMTDFITRILD